MSTHRLKRSWFTPALVIVLCAATAAPALAPPRGRGGHRGGRNTHGSVNRHHSHHRNVHHHHSVRVWVSPRWWHPVGFVVTTLAVTAILVSASDGQDYHYDEGNYYKENDDGSGYTVVPAPIGATIPTLPEGNTPATVGDKTYYYYAGAFYYPEPDGQHYTVVPGPVGAVVPDLPEGYEEKTVNDILYYTYGGIYFQPKSVDGDVQYEVVQAPGG